MRSTRFAALFLALVLATGCDHAPAPTDEHDAATASRAPAHFSLLAIANADEAATDQPHFVGMHGLGALLDGLVPIGTEPTPAPTTAPPDVPAVAATVDLRDRFPPVRDQGQTNACVGFAVEALGEYVTREQLSPLAVWSMERQEENSFPRDVGVYTRGAMGLVTRHGYMAESLLPFPDGVQHKDRAYSPTLWARPSQAQLRQAHPPALDRVVDLKSLPAIKGSLAHGMPVVIGFWCFPNMDTVGPDGELSMPAKSDKPAGGHCVLVVGYDEPKKRLIVRNSWGEAWGNHGYFRMPYDYFPAGYIFEAYTLGEPDDHAGAPPSP